MQLLCYPMALQPNLDLGRFNPPPPNISILCRPSPVLAFQHTLSNPVNCFYPSSSGPSNWSFPFYISFQCFLRRPFVLHPQQVAHLLESSQSDTLGYLHFLVQIIDFVVRPVSKLSVSQHRSTDFP